MEHMHQCTPVEEGEDVRMTWYQHGMCKHFNKLTLSLAKSPQVYNNRKTPHRKKATTLAIALVLPHMVDAKVMTQVKGGCI